MATDATFTQAFDRAFVPVEAAIRSGRIPGGVLGMVDRDGNRMTRALGMASLVPEKRPMTLETWFDLASLSKVLVTTPAILALADRGVIDLDAPLTTHIPNLRQFDPNGWERQVTFRQCLGHQTAFPASEPIFTYGENPNLLRNFVLQHAWTPGPAGYSCINFILLGIALERITGKSLREMDPGAGFAFSAPAEQSAATEFCHWRGRVLSGEVHDENCAALQGAGNAGLFGTVDAVLDRAASLLRDADSPVVTLMRTPVSETRTHGWERPYKGWSGGDLAGSGTIGHTGFTGTGLWVDFDKGRAWTLLTNRVHPSRYADSGIFALRSMVGDLINAGA